MERDPGGESSREIMSGVKDAAAVLKAAAYKKVLMVNPTTQSVER